MSLENLKIAIAKQVPVEFQYNKPGKTPGIRVGNPHAVFIMRKKDGTESTKVHIVQVSGVSDSGQELPSFRMFDLDEVTGVTVLGSEDKFLPSADYNPAWEGYKFVIAKI